jgi:hypothetical protein
MAYFQLGSARELPEVCKRYALSLLSVKIILVIATLKIPPV